VSGYDAPISRSPNAPSDPGAPAGEPRSLAGEPRSRNRSPQARRDYEHELLYAEVVEHLRAIIRELGLTQHDIATRLGRSDARVSHLMSGRENLTLRTLADLGWALGLRFEMVAVPLADRADTPARDDPPAPRWLGRHAQLVARRVREGLGGGG
jgi:transcriptional regulator with XRE-family HTH domain